MPDAEELDLDLLLRPRTGFYLTSLISQTPTVSNRILITHKTKKATAKKEKEQHQGSRASLITNEASAATTPLAALTSA
jgi:hypothetical protein